MREEYMLFDSRSKEAFNTAQLGAVLARSQQYLLPLRFDSNGADVIAYNPATHSTRAIQIKARVTIARIYVGKNLWIAFPHWITDQRQDWYIVPHDVLVSIWGPEKLVNDVSWSAPTPSLALRQALASYKEGSVELS